MIAHVAEVGEARGRVVLRICEANPSTVALAAAIRVARAYQSEVESLFVTDEQVLTLTRYPFVRVVSLSGRSTEPCDARMFTYAYRALAHSVAARLKALAAENEVPISIRMVQDDPLRALTVACAERGPWNVIALAEPVGGYGYLQLVKIFDTIRDVTGIILAGRSAVRSDGPVVVAVDDAASVNSAIRAAARIAAIADERLIVVPVGADDETTAHVEGDLRLMLVDSDQAAQIEIAVAGSTHGEPAAIAEAIRRLGPGFVIARLGGALIPDAAGLKSAIAAFESPLFLAR